MEFRPRLNIFKSSTGKNTFDIFELEATSYNWWIYLKVINGCLVFNNYNYSKTTNGHQGECRYLLDQLGIEPDLIVYQSGCLSHGLNESLVDDYKSLYLEEYRLTKKGLRKDTRSRLESSIESTLEHIARIESLGFTVTKNDKASLKQSVIEREESRLEKQREESKKRRELINSVREELEDISSPELLTKLPEVDDISAIDLTN